MSTTDMISCEEALRRLAEHLDGELDEASDALVHRHLERCRSCYSRAEFERQLKSRVGSLREESVSPAFEARVRSIIETFPTGGGR